MTQGCHGDEQEQVLQEQEQTAGHHACVLLKESQVGATPFLVVRGDNPILVVLTPFLVVRMVDSFCGEGTPKRLLLSPRD